MTIENKAGPVDNQHSKQSVLFTLPYTAVHITGGFWAGYQQTNRDVSLVHGFAMLEEAGNLRNMRIAAGLEIGEFAGYLFADSDIYKWLEAVGWELGRRADAALQKMADETITLIEQTQRDDGYLDSYFQIAAPQKRWTDLDHGHELYCAGHLIQAAIAWQRAVDDARLLRVALKFVDHIEALFGRNGRAETCGHPEIETALVELYRLTGDKRHLELAQLFIDRRGRNTMRGHAGYGAVYQQDHVPVREAVEVAGHAVRQLYLTTGVTDLYMESGEQALLDALHCLWADMTERKLFLTGGVGSRFDGEAFGGPYELPSDTCYCETCAAIASLMWNWRMLLVTGQRQYADLFERTLYNGVLSSPGLDGACYLYVNPLQVRNGRYVRASADTGTGEERLRPAWHNCACCPPNVMRLLASLSHYLATVNATGIQIHQFAAAQLAFAVQGEPAQIHMQTDYPWDGRVSLTVTESGALPWSLSLRIPEWCAAAAVSLNGRDIPSPLAANGYLTVTRSWQAGDVLQLDLPLEPTFTVPNPRIDALRGCVALQRGPLVYCFESRDQPDEVNLLDVQLLTEEPLSVTAVSLLGGIRTISVPGRMITSDWQNSLYRPLTKPTQMTSRQVQLTAVPYFAWGNRGMESMRVWVPQATQ
ncbi:MAG: glycoside hydrolase family 127 protein [Ardenticatenaceae bacterium]|nr:glycoside hydrolase family 127 protein [Ardenticatenaceae bacterium]MCB8986704.1 glycoside hydrolase family 127 protein [Ardenticatenaceae bacterium]